MADVAFRCEAHAEAGLGHLRRSLAVARTLRDRHPRIAFIHDGGAAVDDRITAEGFAPVPVPAGSGLTEGLPGDLEALVVDTKQAFDPEQVSEIRGRARTVFLDRLGADSLEADWVVFPDAALDPGIEHDPRWAGAHARMLHGPAFVIVSEDVRSLRDGATRSPAERAIVTAGARDPAGIMRTVLPWMASHPELPVLALLGSEMEPPVLDNVGPGAGAVSLVPFDVRHLGAPVAVCAFGVTTYELMFLGVPTLSVAHSDENARSSEELARTRGAIVDAGHIRDLTRDRFDELYGRLLRDDAYRSGLGKAAGELLDGRGAERIARIVSGSDDLETWGGS